MNVRLAIREIRDTADGESATARALNPGRVDRDTAIVLVVAAISLTMGQFLADNTIWLEHLLRIVGARGVALTVHRSMYESAHQQFWQLFQWAVVQVVAYVALPALTIRFVLRVPFRSMGLRVRGIKSFALPYVLLYLVSLPVLVAISYSAEFQGRYPFYRLDIGEKYWPYLWLWWACYAVQFVALEFFFRGFLVHGLVPRFGYMAVFVMALPYNMLHYGKPMAEALAAIIGGIVLGTLAIRARSIWWGAALHISIAATMDILSLTHRGRLF